MKNQNSQNLTETATETIENFEVEVFEKDRNRNARRIAERKNRAMGGKKSLIAAKSEKKSKSIKIRDGRKAYRVRFETDAPKNLLEAKKLIASGFFERVFTVEELALREEKRIRRLYWSSRTRLERVQSAARAVGIQLEGNMHCNLPYPRDEKSTIHELNYRVAGMLKALVDIPSRGALIIKLINKTGSGNGFNSPYTNHRWIADAVLNYGGPESINRAIYKARRRGNQILWGFGLSTSWKSLADVMGRGKCRANKAGKHAAAFTLDAVLSHRFGINTLKASRALGYRASLKSSFLLARGLEKASNQPYDVRMWMGSRINVGEFSCLQEAQENCTRLIQDSTDGVELLLDPATTMRKGPISLVLGWRNEWNQGWSNSVWLVTCGERSFHFDDFDQHWDYNKREYIPSHRAAIKEAIQNWSIQKSQEKQLRRMVSLPDNVSLLVYKQDSYDAGNCVPGTEAFMERIGVPVNATFASAHLMLPHISSTDRAKSTYLIAARKLRDQIEKNSSQ